MQGLKAIHLKAHLLDLYFDDNTILPGGPCGLLVKLSSEIAEIVGERESEAADSKDNPYELELRGPGGWYPSKWYNSKYGAIRCPRHAL